ncbi:scavenger receptor cysteine-rich type 1 protein M130-like [Liolophura sinensis]|uniref:scavenger receptor cysteine-rich type 1 protein M130-like n=1 Tax=Liolophura sinensis TaxID=3198878 RepID=UPI0031592CD3
MMVNVQWGVFCPVQMNVRNAEVVCRQLGFKDSVVKVYKYHTLKMPGANFTLLSFRCRGNESRLIECPHAPMTDAIPCNFTAFVECGVRKDFSPRLFDKSITLLRTTGRLEVYLRGNWTPVCDTRIIDDNVAKVACREMRQPSTYVRAIPGSAIFTWDNRPDIENVRFKCSGTEESLSECTREVSHVCNGPVGIVCSFFRDYEVRLVGGDGKVGRVEMKLGHIWWTFCSQGFSDREAGVVCRERRHFPRRFHATVWPNEGFGLADLNTIVWPYAFNCKGNETSLLTCTRRTATSGLCTHDKDVAVSCKTLRETLPMRLVGGPSSTSGRLEVSVNGRWGTVCRRHFSSQAAKVACRQMGLRSTQAKVLSTDIRPLSTGPVFLDFVTCTGKERHILSCPYSKVGVSNCSHDLAVAIECKRRKAISTGKSPACRDGSSSCKAKPTKGSVPTRTGTTTFVVFYCCVSDSHGILWSCNVYRHSEMPWSRCSIQPRTLINLPRWRLSTYLLRCRW